jgi:PEP-CTERM motif
VKISAFAAAAAVATGLTLAGSAHATVYTVDALLDSSNSGAGTGLATIALTNGEAFTSDAALDDLWSAGALPRWSNAAGLTGDTYATGTDESGEASGTQIGMNFGLLNIGGFSAPYGALVGQIGTGAGSYRLLGTHFAGPAWATGTLNLFYWDTYTGDNSHSVAVNLQTGVPEPAAWSLMIVGFGAAGAMLRRRQLAAI